MRTALLVLATAVLLVGGFVAYWLMQPDSVAHPRAAGAAATQKSAPLPEGESTYTVRGGTNVWLKEFDANRRLTNQFRAEEFVPQKEGFVRVKKPEAHFFLRGGQWIRVTGEAGDVIVSGLPEQGSDPFNGVGGAAPSRGRLENVHLQYYETADASTPTLDMEMANAAFDNESFRIFTEGYTDKAGHTIAADQVKVTVRGKYDFDGRGLTIRWNDADRRLELLEIAHGERLVVKDFGALGEVTPGKVKDAKKPAARFMPADPRTALASADPRAGAAVAAAASQPGDPNRESTLYSVWFYDDVRVEQGGKTLASGSEIEVFYAMREKAVKPATAPATQKQQPTVPTESEASAKPQAAVEAPANARVKEETPTTQPTTQEVQEPVTIYWTGKLRMVPSETEPPVALAPGESAVQMRGAPVILTRDNARVRCPAFTYRTSDGRVMLHTSEKFPQAELAQFAAADTDRTGKPQMTLLSESVEYAPDEGIATLRGKSRAIFPADETGASGELAEASWTREGVARFTGSGEDSVITSLNLAGDVDVRHPQLSLKSQRLDLAFDLPPPAPARPKGAAAKADAKAKVKEPPRQPTVRQVVAEGDVLCVLPDEEAGTRELRGQHLVIATAKDAAGNLYPRQVNANGEVRALQQGSELTSEELAIELVPTTRPAAKPGEAKADAKGAEKAGAKAVPAKTAAVELKRLTAKSNVRAISEKGDVATGDALVVVNAPDGKPQVTLTGKPARVENAAGTVLTSEQIVIPNGDEARAIGPGTLHAVVEDADPTIPKRHMDVSWQGSALMNGKLPEHQVQVVGKVRTAMPEADGTVNTAAAEQILITLADAPPPAADATTKPSARKGTPAQPDKGKSQSKKKQKDDGGGPEALASADVDVMKGRQVSRILLNKDAVVDSRLLAPDGTVLRETRIESSMLQYDVPTRRLIVPRPGTMLVRDHRPPEEKKEGPLGAPPAPAEEEEDGLDGSRGATAFKWSDSLDYNGAERHAKFAGEVVVAYKPDEPKELPVQLRENEVFATFEDAPKDPKDAKAKAAPKGPSDLTAAPKVRPRSVRADGNVIVNRGPDELTAPRVTYDPITHWIRALGNAQTPAVYTTAGRAGTTQAREFHWNTKTWQMRVVDAMGRTTAGR